MAEPDQETPSARMRGMLDGALVAQLIQVVAELDIAEHVTDGPVPVERLAENTHSDPDALYRALRTLASVGVFTESAPRSFGPTPLAEVLREGVSGSVRDVARMRGEPALWQTWERLRYSVSTGRSAFEHVHGTDRWSYLAEHPEDSALFDRVMAKGTQRVHSAAVEALDLSGVRRLVDIGGGHGSLVTSILRQRPDVHAVVFDQENTLRGAEHTVAEAGVADRVDLVAGDFFETVPTGGDMYILSRILHDWNDDAATAILRNIRRAMPAHARVLVIDSLVPEGDTPHPSKMTDMIMLALHEGRERTETEFARLFDHAGLRLTDTLPTSSPASLVTGVSV